MQYKVLTFFLLLSGICFGQKQNKPDSLFSIANEKSINTKNLEFSPAFYEDGIIFISTRAGEGKLKGKDNRLNKDNFSIFRATRDQNGMLKDPVQFSDDLNTKYNEGPLTFNKTQDRVYFCRSNLKNGKELKGKDGTTHMNLFMAEKQGDHWVNITALPFNDVNYDYVHPSIGVDEDKLFFSSNRPGGFGGMDLYMCEKKGNTWGDPVNLGPKINSKKNEIFPFIHADGTLFFASDGHAGQGGLDLFFALQKKETWTDPINLGTPLNSSGDDFGLIVDLDKKNGYFSSTRIGGVGEDDIYNFHTDGRIGENPENNLLVDVTIFLADKSSSQELSGVKVDYIKMDELVNTEIITDADGNVTRIKTAEGETSVLAPGKLEGMSGLTDEEGKLPVKLNPTKYLFNLTKEGYQSKQVVREIGKENNEFLVLLESAQNSVLYKGSIVNELYNTPVTGATITFTDDETQASESVTSDQNGAYEYNLKCGKSYTVTISKKGFNTGTKKISNVDCNKKDQLTDQVTSLYGFSAALAEGSIIRLPNIYYNFNDATIRPDAQRDLDALIALLQQYPDLKIELSSHTDSRGTEEYNKDLSQRRADNAKEYLVNHQIVPDRVVAVGYGESRLKNNCKDGVYCTELGHQYNRRTEVKILKNGPDVNVEYMNNPPEVVSRKDEYDANHKTEPDQQVANPVSVETSTDSSRTVENVDYVVVAGTFGVEANANAQLDKIKSQGYQSAEIIVYEGSGLRAVCVQRFTNMEDGQRLVSELKSKKIAAFVKLLPR